MSSLDPRNAPVPPYDGHAAASDGSSGLPAAAEPAFAPPAPDLGAPIPPAPPTPHPAAPAPHPAAPAPHPAAPETPVASPQAAPPSAWPQPPANPTLEAAKAAAKTGLTDALAVIGGIALAPVPGLPRAYEQLKDRRAMAVGIVFAVVGALVATFLVHSLIPEWIRAVAGVSFLKLLGVLLLPFASFTAAHAGARKVLGQAEGYGRDVLVAGTALLPSYAFIALASLLGAGNPEVITILGVLAIFLMALILYGGCLGVARMSARAATFAAPAIFLLSAWLTTVLLRAWLGQWLGDLLP